MKSNKEKVYDFIRLHADEKADRGISTAYIADAHGTTANECKQHTESSGTGRQDTKM